MAGLPKLNSRASSRGSSQDSALRSCPEFPSMARTRRHTQSCSESTTTSADDDHVEELCTFAALEEYAEGSVARFMESSRKSDSLASCKKVGSYYVGRMLGAGTFGKVKLGVHILSGVKVAVKIYQKKLAVDSYVLQNVHREVKLLQRVQHHNIMRLYDFIETDNNFYLVTELCSNGSLLDLVAVRGSLEEGETREYLRQIVSAVDCLHANGIVHRDIKLENLLLTNSMTIKLIDFGLSNTEGSQTQCGSPLYAAPEMLGAKSYGKEVDVWSIGVCLYMMLMAVPPYQLETTAGIAGLTVLHAKMMDGRMNRIKDNISTSCQNLILKMLCYDPAKRITIADTQKHPWITMKGFYPLPPAPICQVTSLSDLNHFVLSYMSEIDSLQGPSLASLEQGILENKINSSVSTYHLLVEAYQHCVTKHKKASKSHTMCKRSSSDHSISKKASPVKTPPPTEDNRKTSLNQLPPLPTSEGLPSTRKTIIKNRYAPVSVSQPPANSRTSGLSRGHRSDSRQATRSLPGKRLLKSRQRSRQLDIPTSTACSPKVPQETVTEFDHFAVLTTINESTVSPQRQYQLASSELEQHLFPLTEETSLQDTTPGRQGHCRRPRTQEKSNRWLWKRTADKQAELPCPLPDIDKEIVKSGKSSLEQLPYEEWIESGNGDISDSRDH